MWKRTNCHKAGYCLWLLFSLTMMCNNAKAENYQELLLFPSLQIDFRSADEASEQATEGFDTDIAADLFFALSYEKTRFLTEALASTEEIELERAQLGWEYQTGHRFWLGRFHSPLGYWNTQYNHSGYLQTSIHRPGITRFEDHGGILPMHAAGLMGEGEATLGKGILEYTFIYGAGSQMGYQELESTRLLNLRERGIGTNILGRLAYRPDETRLNQLAIFSGYTELRPEEGLQTSVDQTIIGGYVVANHMSLQVIADIFYVRNDVKTPTSQQSVSFVAGYIHGEYGLTRSLINYIRYEDSAGTTNDAYISLFKPFEKRALVFGLRYDWNSTHAFTTEISTSQDNGQTKTHGAIKWSAVFP